MQFLLIKIEIILLELILLIHVPILIPKKIDYLVKCTAIFLLNFFLKFRKVVDMLKLNMIQKRKKIVFFKIIY